MDERAVRLECLRLALTTNPTHVKPAVERAAEYVTFVMQEQTPEPEKARPRSKSDTARAKAAPDGQDGKTSRQPGETG